MERSRPFACHNVATTRLDTKHSSGANAAWAQESRFAPKATGRPVRCSSATRIAAMASRRTGAQPSSLALARGSPARLPGLRSKPFAFRRLPTIGPAVETMSQVPARGRTAPDRPVGPGLCRVTLLRQWQLRPRSVRLGLWLYAPVSHQPSAHRLGAISAVMERAPAPRARSACCGKPIQRLPPGSQRAQELSLRGPDRELKLPQIRCRPPRESP